MYGCTLPFCPKTEQQTKFSSSEADATLNKLPQTLCKQPLLALTQNKIQLKPKKAYTGLINAVYVQRKVNPYENNTENMKN